MLTLFGFQELHDWFLRITWLISKAYRKKFVISYAKIITLGFLLCIAGKTSNCLAISLKNYLMIKICLIPKWFSFLSSDWLSLLKSSENLSTAQIAPISVCPQKFGRNSVHTQTFSADGKIGDDVVPVFRL